MCTFFGCSNLPDVEATESDYADNDDVLQHGLQYLPDLFVALPRDAHSPKLAVLIALICHAWVELLRDDSHLLVSLI